jgi:general nucleoside transport system ATP-binding protein
MSQLVAAVRDIIKAYPGTLASRGVSIEFFSGQIHALLGENGAGKSTLVKMLAGLIQPDGGTIELDGKPIRLTSPRAARAAGIGVVHQSGSLIASMTVEENLRLVQSYSARDQGAGPASQSHLPLPLKIDLRRLVRSLSPRERQLIEIHRLLALDVKLLVLDEPTSTLTAQESDLLLGKLRTLADAGYAIVVVSHKLSELLTYADQFTVLRKGQVVAHLSRSEVTVEHLVQLISGYKLPSARVSLAGYPIRAKPAKINHVLSARSGQTLVRFKNVSTSSADAQESPLHKLNLTLARGEILGIAGRPGSGAANIIKLLYGEHVVTTSGSIEWFDKSGRAGKPSRSIGLVPADRQSYGVISSLTIGDNLVLRRRHLLGSLAARRRRHTAAELIRLYDVRPADQDVSLEKLSGGNMQKVLLARELEYSDELLLASSPTAGLDVGSAEFVFKLLSEKAAAGTCVVVHSDDIDELLAIADRIVVIFDGCCLGELSGSQLTRTNVGGALSGISSQPLPENQDLRREATVACVE